MAMATEARTTLVQALRARSVAVDDAHVDAALGDAESGPGLTAWIETHLTGDTLLSLDELALLDALERSGGAEALAGDGDGDDDGGPAAAVVPLTDAELRAATAALDASTDVLRQQAAVLQQQQEAAARLGDGGGGKGSGPGQASTHDARAAFEARRLGQWDGRRGDLAVAVERLARDLDARVDDLVEQNGALAQRVRQTVDGLCRSDDTLLASLQKLGWALPVGALGGDGNEAETKKAEKKKDDDDDDDDDKRQQRLVARLRDTCLHRIKLTVETVRTRLDRLYLETLAASVTSSSTAAAAAAAPADVAALQAELESLYAEILPVAQMAVEQQFLEPALRAVAGKTGKKMAVGLGALDYMDECLEFLLEHIGLLAVRIETAAAHHAAAEALAAAARTELAVSVPTGRRRDEPPRRRSLYGSPMHRRQSSAASHVSHARTRSGTVGTGSAVGSAAVKTHRRRSSGFGSGLASVPPLDQLLESLSLPLPLPMPMPDDMALPAVDGAPSASAAAAATRTNAAFLASTLAERAAKADDVAHNAQASFETAVALQLADARRAVTMARACVLAGSPFAVQLADPEIDASVGVVAHEVAEVRARIDALQQHVGVAQRGRSAKREQMIARWA